MRSDRLHAGTGGPRSSVLLGYRSADHHWSPAMVRLALLARAVWHVSFALYLLQQREQSVTALLEAFIRFAFVDGLLAVVESGAYLAFTPSRMLWLSPAIDAVTRGALVGIAMTGPGLLDMPLTALLYLGLVATFAFSDGAVDLAEGISIDRELGHGSGWLALVGSGTVATLVGVLLVAAHPAVPLVRGALVALSAAHLAVCASGMRHVPMLSAHRFPGGNVR